MLNHEVNLYESSEKSRAKADATDEPPLELVEPVLGDETLVREELIRRIDMYDINKRDAQRGDAVPHRYLTYLDPYLPLKSAKGHFWYTTAQAINR